MRLIFVLFTVFFSVNGLAGDYDFSYQYKFRPTGFSIELDELTKHFEEKSFNRLSAFPVGNLPFVHADEVLYSSSHAGTIFIKLGLIAPVEQRFKLITSGNLTLYHTNSASIAFFDFTPHEVQVLSSGLSQKVSYNVMDVFIPTAEASDQIFCHVDVKNSFSNLEQVSDKINQSLLVKKIGECALMALKGVEGNVEDIKKFFSNLSDPKKMWNEMKQNYDQLKHLVTNFTAELQSFYKTMSGLTVQDMLDIGCKMVGDIGSQFLIAATGAGAGIAVTKLVTMTLPKLQRLKKLLELSQRGKISKQTAKESLSCAI